MGFVPVDLLSSSTRFVVVKIVIPVAAIVVTVIMAVVFAYLLVPLLLLLLLFLLHTVIVAVDITTHLPYKYLLIFNSHLLCSTKKLAIYCATSTASSE